MSIAGSPQLLERSQGLPAKVRSAAAGESSEPPSWKNWLADACLITLFLSLTFLLGVFPLKDADFYWHLRTGDLIRQTGRVPHVDIFTFERQGTPWIDLHWVFQIGISWLYQHGGVVALNLAKCGLTCLAVFLLITARRPDWPVWVITLAWLPALLVLGGRMYVRPETLTLLYLAIFLAVVTRWDRRPALAFLLPLVQVAWVNSQGLFVLGPIILILALLDSAMRPGAFASDQRKWWRTIGMASLATAAACVVNPYGLAGALYPLQLASTMGNPVFSRSIAELLPVPEFIRRAGWWNLPLQLHLATIALGALSFLIPLCWLLGVRLFGSDHPRANTVGEEEVRSRSQKTGRERRGSRSRAARGRGTGRARLTPAAIEPSRVWGISPFRLLLYVAFCLLSLQATRNTHQFAAVAGSVTAWNFAEWAALLRRRRASMQATVSKSSGVTPRLITGCVTALLSAWILSGSYYAICGEHRTIGLGEEPLWFPHEATRFAGKPGMPDRFLAFHNGHASLYEYYHGPERKVYTDPRLEVAGADLFERYRELERRILQDQPGWEADLDRMGRPAVLVDHEYNTGMGATLLRSGHWRCVWFDSIAAVFVHDSYRPIVEVDTVDFAARHFRPAESAAPQSLAELAASARALRNYVTSESHVRPDLARPLAWLGEDYARRILRDSPDSVYGWKNLGPIELFREPPAAPSPRFRLPFDPVFDLSLVRATYALKRASQVAPSDFLTLFYLWMAYEARAMDEAVLPILDRIASVHPINLQQVDQQNRARAARPELVRKLASRPSLTWRNKSELDQIETALLASGRAASAAELLEMANPSERASWEVLDRTATLWLHLGEPVRARKLLELAAGPPQLAIREARIGTTYLVEGDFEAARRHYRRALEDSPDSFEAHYSLAVLEQDAGDAVAAYDHAFHAIKLAPHEAARSAARVIASSVGRFGREAAKL
jgi:tetratricopeptide (TPR) repeat protein